VVAHYTYIVADEVAEVGYAVVWPFRYKVEVVAGGFALQYVTAVDKDCAYGIVSTLLRHESMHPLQTSLSPAFMTEIVGEIVAVDVGCEDNLYFALQCVHLAIIKNKLVQNVLRLRRL
jgi:hypothetical protein